MSNGMGRVLSNKQSTLMNFLAQVVNEIGFLDSKVNLVNQNN